MIAALVLMAQLGTSGLVMPICRPAVAHEYHRCPYCGKAWRTATTWTPPGKPVSCVSTIVWADPWPDPHDLTYQFNGHRYRICPERLSDALARFGFVEEVTRGE